MRYIAEDRALGRVGQMHDRDERLFRFRRELLVAAARVRQELQPGRSLSRTIRKSIAQAIEHLADTVDTINDEQIAEFDAAACGDRSR